MTAQHPTTAELHRETIDLALRLAEACKGQRASVVRAAMSILFAQLEADRPGGPQLDALVLAFRESIELHLAELTRNERHSH